MGSADKAIVKHERLSRSTEFEVNGAKFSGSSMNFDPIAQPGFPCAPTEMKDVFVFVDQRVAMQVDILRSRPSVRHIACSLPRIQKHFLSPAVRWRGMCHISVEQSEEHVQIVAKHVAHRPIDRYICPDFLPVKVGVLIFLAILAHKIESL